MISTRRYGANAGREYSLEGGVIEDGECHEGGLSFRGWITALRDLGPGDLRKGDTIYVDKTERMSVQDGAWYRREAALLCRLR